MGYFYKQLFYCLCNYIHTKTGFNLVNEKDHMFIKLKTDWNTDNHNGKKSKFRLLTLISIRVTFSYKPYFFIDLSQKYMEDYHALLE